MDGQFPSSGFQLYGQPLQAPAVQQSGQQLHQNPTPQQLGGFTLIPAPAAGGQPTLTGLRNQPVQILQQAAPVTQAKPQQQAGGLGGVTFQPQTGQAQQPQPQQQRLHAAQLQGLTSQQLQYLQAAQQSGQLTATGLQSYSQAPPQLGAIQILQPKAQQPQPQQPQQQQQQGVVGRGFQQGQPAMQGMQMLPQQTPQALQPGQNLQGLQGLQGLQQAPGLQTIPGVQVLQQYPGFSQQQQQPPQQPQLGNSAQPKQGAVAGGRFPSSHQPPVGSAPGTGSSHHTGSLFSNSNQRGGYGQGRHSWNNERDRNERTEMRGRPRERGRREDRGSFGSRTSAREPPSRFSRERETFRHDRGNRERYDRGFRDYNRRERDRKPSPMHPPYDFKKEDVRKEPHREMPHKAVHTPLVQEIKMPLPLPMPVKPPPVADYVVKVPQVPFATHERDYSDIARRYTHLYISPDFTKLVCRWAKIATEKRHPYGCSLCPLNKPVKFDMVQGPYEPDQEIVLPAAKNESSVPIRWNAKCTFLCGLDEKIYEDVLKGKFEGGTHMMNVLKFVTVREEKEKKKTGIMCLGGPYDPDLDGGNPEEDIEGLKRACMRHVKAQTLLDLTPCTSWIRFCDVHYRRTDANGEECDEVTVIFIVDVSEIVPSAEEWPTVWKEHNEWKIKAAQSDSIMATTAISSETPTAQENGAEKAVDSKMEEMKKDTPTIQETIMEDEKLEDAPKEVSLLMKCRTAKNGRLKTMSISLDGLLDYDENDKDEATFELSLMAESFNEMLMRDYGLLILKALMENRSISSDAKTDDKKRPVSQLPQETPAPLGKKQKQTETTTETLMDHTSETAEETKTEPAAAAAAEEDMEMQQCPDSPGDVVHVGDIEAQPESTPTDNAPETAILSKQDTTEVNHETAGEVDVVMEASDEKSTEAVVHEELLFAFRYFDRAGCGYIKCDDLRRLLHNLGCCLAPRVVRELVHGAAAMNKEKHDRVCYRSLTDKGMNDVHGDLT